MDGTIERYEREFQALQALCLLSRSIRGCYTTHSRPTTSTSTSLNRGGLVFRAVFMLVQKLKNADVQYMQNGGDYTL